MKKTTACEWQRSADMTAVTDWGEEHCWIVNQMNWNYYTLFNIG